MLRLASCDLFTRAFSTAFEFLSITVQQARKYYSIDD